MPGETTQATLLRLLENARLEVLPTSAAEGTILAHVPRDTVITVTASPSRGLEATLDLSERLSSWGYPVVPHLAARMISGRPELSEIVGRLTSAGIDRVFVPGGDASPRGDYQDSLAVLEDLAALGSPFSQVGITGYPEPHPAIHEDLLIQSMWDKRRYATHIVSNLTFSPAAVRSWIERVRARGVSLPVLLGVPGPVERAKLLAIATRIGVGESTRFLAKNKGLFARLLSPGGFTGERFVSRCAPFLGAAGARVDGLHVYTFGQIEQSQAWRTELIRRLRSEIGDQPDHSRTCRCTAAVP